jgi:hypothetical protein
MEAAFINSGYLSQLSKQKPAIFVIAKHQSSVPIAVSGGVHSEMRAGVIIVRHHQRRQAILSAHQQGRE